MTNGDFSIFKQHKHLKKIPSTVMNTDFLHLSSLIFGNVFQKNKSKLKTRGSLKDYFWFSVLGLLHLMKQKRVEHSRFVKCSSTWLQSEYCEDSWISLSHRNSFRLHFNKDLSRHGGYLCIMSVFLFSALQQVWCDSEDQFDQQVFDLFPVEAFNS